MTYRLYSKYDQILVRTGRAYRDMGKALDAARYVTSKLVEVRALLPNGREQLVAILRDGVQLSS